VTEETSSEERSGLIAQATALTELETRDRAFPLYSFRPIPKLTSFFSSRASTRIISGGNRSGKSHHGGAELACQMLGYRPWILREMGLPIPEKPWIRPENLPVEALCFNRANIRIPVPNTVFCVTGQSAKKGIGETMWPKLKEFLGPFITDTHMSHAGVPADFQIKNGSRCVFGSAEQGQLAFESTNYAFTHIDEPVPRRVYVGIKRGSIDQFAQIVMTFTPIGPWAAWIFRELYSNANLTPKELDKFKVSIFDNPYLPKEAVEEWAKDPTISEIERQARLYGDFTHLVDRIYSSFREDINVVPDFNPSPDEFHGMVVDPHTVRPWAIAYFFVNARGDLYFHKEWPPEDFTKMRRSSRGIEDYANLIRKLDSVYPIAIRFMDPNYGPRKDMIRGIAIPSVRDDIARYGLHFDTSVKDDLAYGESRVRSLLAWDDSKPMDSLNRPRLFITESCRNLINAMNFYTAKSRPNTEVADEERREETYKDFADLVRYVAVSSVGQMGGMPSMDWGQFGPEDASDLGNTGYGEP